MQAKKKTTTKPVREIAASSGNVFADLEVPNPGDALAKAELAQRINVLISERKLTQERAATVLGIDQPKISALSRGKLAGFSTDRLIRFLNALGQDVEIVVRPRNQVNGRTSTRVIDS
jgi:predicted XRE-type DNA-binding protein